MKTIGIFTTKGGSGKTTCTFNIAGVLAKEYGKKVLLIDGDPSSNLTQCCLAAAIEETGSADFLNNEVCIEDLFFFPEKVNDSIKNVKFSLISNTQPKKRGIDIIPTRNIDIHPKRRLKNSNDALSSGAFESGQIKNALSMIKRTGNHRYDYDFCLIDFEGASELDNKSTEFLLACDYVLIPATIDSFSASQTAAVKVHIDKVNEEYGTNIQVIGVFGASTDNSSVYDEQMLDVYRSALGKDFLDVSIRRSKEAVWSTQRGIPVIYYKKTHPLTNDFKKLTEEMLKRIGEL